MALLFPAGQQFGDSNLDPVGAGKLYVYDNETTNEASIYSDPELTASLSNPVVLDSAGRLTTNVYLDGSVAYTVKLDNSSDAEQWSRDDVFGWADSILYIGGNGAVEAIGNARFGIGSSIDSAGESALSRTMPGVELTAQSMNTTSKYTPAVKFMSTDSSFTTENPKFLAAIAGEATQAYTGDTTGGMQLVFFATDGAPGATNIPVQVMALRGDLEARFEGGIFPSGQTAAGIYSGSGTPESSITAAVGSIYLRTDGGANTTLYVKESGAGDTGWAAI